MVIEKKLDDDGDATEANDDLHDRTRGFRFYV